MTDRPKIESVTHPTSEPRLAVIAAALPVPPVARSGEVEGWQLFDRDGNSCAHRPEVQQRVAELKCQEFNATPELTHKAPYTVRPLYASPAPSGAPNQARDDIGVDDGATDGYAVSMARAVPEDVIRAVDRLIRVADMGDYEQINTARSALLALYRPAGETVCECADWEPETRKLDAPIITAQARNPHLTQSKEFAFKSWSYCPWCGERARNALTAAPPPSHAGETK